ncbi:ATP-binding protein [Xanthomonas campestris pv. incanae]|uniref:AAA family ATPase n=2 Tax=Xanthomonas campestris TaxID=339 RepID=UPI0029C3282E|nr:ATP-binding protein [Xanthomonas campestris]MDX6081306.1 ATP-binding protein [Xanthomonas campestris pv. incanae]MDX6085915.1 ATP-binding protein [Xanthomonas campestris pv. incanae]MDX6139185.1 ATP-binding protein [Xanthomonas campestris pv. incanae]
MSKDYQLTAIKIDYFRKLRTAHVELRGLNLVVGGNSAGKSSLLQGLHFGVSVATARRVTDNETFPQDALLYCPSGDFTELRHSQPYTNQSFKGHVTFYANSPGGAAVEHKISIYRGRNAGNVGCNRSGDVRLGQLINDPVRPFSVYVPGLAGIPRVEEYRSEGIVRRGVAGGDANLYLRNVLYLIQQKMKLPDLLKKIRQIFPRFEIKIAFDVKVDVGIDVKVSDGNQFVPVDLAGTGLLQALQIFSYITLFEPTILLLDEPDAHLHPNNQVALARALVQASRETETQIICSTHSRNLVEALTDEAQFIWLRDGAVHQQGAYMPVVPLLMDIGAFDSLDRIKNGRIDWFILSEDSDMRMLQLLFEHADFNLARCEFRSYGSSSKLESALAMAAYTKEMWPQTNVIIHRDRDFMTQEEVEIISKKITSADAISFITQGSDIESYFLQPAHVSYLLGVDEVQAIDWLNAVARQRHNEATISFVNKRNEVKLSSIYRGGAKPVPDSAVLMGNSIPLPPSHLRGKDMLKWVRPLLSKDLRNVDLIQRSPVLDVLDLYGIRVEAQRAHAPVIALPAVKAIAPPIPAVRLPLPAPPVAGPQLKKNEIG